MKLLALRRFNYSGMPGGCLLLATDDVIQTLNEFYYSQTLQFLLPVPFDTQILDKVLSRVLE